MHTYRVCRVVLAAAAASFLGCGHEYVKVDQMALGKVVVYRNGVAYYQRRARLDGENLKVAVPASKVDDFLKSLTVADAATGKPLPVSFPSRGQESGGVVQMTIALPRTGSTDVVLTYISEAPAWKPSYRVTVAPDGALHLQGWAIVDNTSGEDWNDVVVGVGSSSALSFRYDLWSIRDIHRETLHTNDRFALAPPTGGTTHGDDGDAEVVIGALSEGDLPVPDTHPASEARRGAAGGRDDGKNASPRKKAAEARYQQLAKELQRSGRNIVIKGYASPGESAAVQNSQDRANRVRNELIDLGVSPAQLGVEAVGEKSGMGAGVELVAEKPDAKAAQAAISDDPVGESHFESPVPMTVHEGRSVMVSIVKQDTEGEIVYLYDPETERGNPRFAFKAVRLENPTDATLESGPVTVYGDSQFIGEGLTEPIPPRARVMVPFALDRQIVVERDETMRDQLSQLVTLQRGVLTSEVQHLRRSTYKLHNRLRKPVTVFVRHSVPTGWKITQQPKDVERLGTAYLFPVVVPAGESRKVTIEAATPMTKTLSLYSPAVLDMVRVYLSHTGARPGLGEQLAQLLALNKEISDEQQEIDSLRRRMGDYRVRMDELHAQIVTLKAVRSGGRLLAHLKDKMEDISERVQKATIQVVDHEEKLMLAKIRFEDLVADLTLAAPAKPETGASSAKPDPGAPTQAQPGVAKPVTEHTRTRGRRADAKVAAAQ